MKINDFQEEFALLKKINTSTDINGKPLIIRNQTKHTITINPNLEPALLVTLLNYVPKMCNADEPSMNITTTEFALFALEHNKAIEYNIFIRQVNTLIDKQVAVSMYKISKEKKKEIVLPDFEYFFGRISNYKDTDNISKELKIEYTNNFISAIKECIIKNEIVVEGNSK